MEGTLSAMDTHLASTFHIGQSNEEMKHLLICATLELESAKAEGQIHEAKVRHHEARVRHLEEVLSKMRKERDEYRDKCNQLQARLSRSPSLGSGLSDGITVGLSSVQQMESVSSMPEPTRCTLSEVHRQMQEQHQQQQQLDLQHLEMQQQIHGHHLELQPHHMIDMPELRQDPTHMSSQQLDQFQQQIDMQQHPGDQAREQLALDMHSPDRQSANAQCTEGLNPGSVTSTPWSDFPTGVQMKMRGSDQSCSILDESLRLHMDFPQDVSRARLDHNSPSLEEFHDHQMQLQLQQQQRQHQHQHQQQQQQQQQQRQESEQLLAHMQHQQRNSPASQCCTINSSQCSTIHMGDEQACHSGLSEGRDVGVHGMSVLPHSSWQMPPHSSSLMQNGLVSSSVSNLDIDAYAMVSPAIPTHHQSAPQLLQSGSAVASILSPLERYGDSPSSSLLSPRPMHLPVPPEADMQHILNSLPEKGKLLQAVMKAGPLLQTLLLSGPLPQWRHPPPAMDSVEIPRVSMSSASLAVPSLEQHSSPVSGMGRNGGSAYSSHGMRMSMHNTAASNGGLCHAMSLPVAGISTGLNPPLGSQRSLPQRLPLSNSHLSHDMSLLGPPLKYAKIH
ncbi:hypothetical protein MPTK1_4g15860 [Marchantia polymorpha subsp. ruderalis]|uniref:Uncharacterized protein n=2 Tax=Marchantia polymorpha TaxID=3197 RepID=A0AAF6BAB8_MARPO|nr:hypothetical protein MARPO_0054s0051 [Marchantia polymorpha]BBN08952.1 hypothetical protein Mp_4g15860 [Marchantia polymorpha subsp. ruderalis]|eukprot:PTQ37939.1 hypothetical protein MARPO_0054s0051 [Marchantia polymorpha]